MIHSQKLKLLTQTLSLIFALIFALILASISANTFAAEDGKYNKDMSMATILDSDELRAVMAKYVPDMMSNPEIDQARVISLGELAGYVPDQLTDKVIDSIIAEFNKLKK